MDLFRLTYFVGNDSKEDKWKFNQRFEIWGSAEAIFDVWFHLTELECLFSRKLHYSACPMFIEVYNKDGRKQDMSSGLNNLIASSSNTFK